MDTYDVLILGTGPAGLQAAIHAGRKNVSVLVLGRWKKSSLFRVHVENYCCLGKLSGEEMLKGGRIQAEASGARFMDEDVLKLDLANDRVFITTESGKEVEGKTLIIAIGISRNRLGIPGEKSLLGQGVSYCVDCDANFFRNEKVAVIGNGSAAVSGALHLTAYASEVTLIHQGLEVAQELVVQLDDSSIITLEGVKVVSINGENLVESVSLEDGRKLDVAGVFIEQGARGAVELAGVLGVNLDRETMKYIQTDKKQQTNIKSVYAAGDICGPPWQMAKAVGEGCVAGIEAANYAKRIT